MGWKQNKSKEYPVHMGNVQDLLQNKERGHLHSDPAIQIWCQLITRQSHRSHYQQTHTSFLQNITCDVTYKGENPYHFRIERSKRPCISFSSIKEALEYLQKILSYKQTVNTYDEKGKEIRGSHNQNPVHINFSNIKEALKYLEKIETNSWQFWILIKKAGSEEDSCQDSEQFDARRNPHQGRILKWTWINALESQTSKKSRENAFSSDLCNIQQLDHMIKSMSITLIHEFDATRACKWHI